MVESYICPLCGKKSIEKIIDPKRTPEALEAHVNLHDTISFLRHQDEYIRKYLWLRHGCKSLYGDDGEMQCNNHRPSLDFKRMSLLDLISTLLSEKDNKIEVLRMELKDEILRRSVDSKK